MTQRSVEIVQWKDVKNETQSLKTDEQGNNTFLDQLDDLPVIKASYPFGSAVEKNGVFSLFINDELVECRAPFIPKELSQLLGYKWKGMPLCMVKNGSFEMFIDHPTHLIPLNLYEPGELMAIYGLFDQAQYSNLVRGAYCTTAGSRSLITLPKISHTLYNHRLGRKFAIRNHLCPKTLEQQWALFNEICNSPLIPSLWRAELILFSKEFVQALREAPNLENQILHKLFSLTTFTRNHAMYDLLWSTFLEDYSLAIRNTPFVVETAKHILKLAMGEAPGYVPATDDTSGPISELIDIYLNVYKIRYYLPIFMQPDTYDNEKPIYYSLHRHTFFHHLPQKSGANRTIDELKNIQELLVAFKERVLNDDFHFTVADTRLFQTMKNVEFDFFHPQGNGDLNTNISQILKDDPRFLTMLNQYTLNKELEFPEHSVFFNGCIRIRPLPDDKRTTPAERTQKASMKDFLATIKR